MNQQHLYVAEKLRELEAQDSQRPPLPPVEGEPQRKPRPLSPVVRATGRRFRRLGEALERWASPAGPACDAS